MNLEADQHVANCLTTRQRIELTHTILMANLHFSFSSQWASFVSFGFNKSLFFTPYHATFAFQFPTAITVPFTIVLLIRPKCIGRSPFYFQVCSFDSGSLNMTTFKIVLFYVPCVQFTVIVTATVGLTPSLE